MANGVGELARQAVVLEAAAGLFSRRGFAATTMAAIAEAAGCTREELESWFEDEHDVLAGLVALIRREAEELFLITLPDELAVEKKLELLLRHQAEWGNRRRDALSFFGRSEPHKPQRREQLDLDQQYIEGTIGWFKRHRVGSELGLRVSEEVAAHVFSALQVGFFERWVSRGGSESFHDNSALVLDVFLNGVRG